MCKLLCGKLTPICFFRKGIAGSDGCSSDNGFDFSFAISVSSDFLLN